MKPTQIATNFSPAVFVTILLTLMGTGCERKLASHATKAPPQETFDSLKTGGDLANQRKIRPKVASVDEATATLKEISEAFDEFEVQCPKGASAEGETHPDCAMNSVRFKPASPAPSSVHQRILILDELEVPPSALLRYRHRVLDFVRLSKNPNQSMEAWIPEARVHPLLHRISAEILSEKPHHVPVETLHPLKERFLPLRAVQGVNYEFGSNHMNIIFELLADLNPDAQFVLGEVPTNGIPTEIYCGIEKKGNIDWIRRHLTRSSLAIAALVKKQEITHINISYEPSHKSITRGLWARCRRSIEDVDPARIQELKDVYADFYEHLSQLQDVLIFKSLPNYPHRLSDPAEANDRLECTPFDNFVGVGFFEKALSHLSSEGGAYSDELAYESQRGNRLCATVMVNGGFEGDEPGETGAYGPAPFTRRYYGLYTTPEKIAMSTSWATPIALSYAIHLANNEYEKQDRYPSPREVKALLGGKGEKPMIDPLFFRQFELYAR